MFSSLFKKSVSQASHAPENKVLFAVGDVHGRADLLRELLPALWRERGEQEGKHSTTIFLGDYIDRGPASDEVLEILIRLQNTKLVDWLFLRGNHEQALLDFLEDPSAGPSWGDWGGRETMANYGVEAPYGGDTRLWRMARDALETKMPRAHVAFLKSMPAWFQAGDYFFAHGGARPGVSLERQHPHDLMTIRGPFLEHSRAFEKIVVHGHSIAAEVHSDHRRIGIDTGAYATGTLTAVRLEGPNRRLIQTKTTPGGPEVELVTQDL